MNHLALITDDMDTTTRFWHGVLGAWLVAHLGTDSFRHYFFEFGEEQTVAFFENNGSRSWDRDRALWPGASSPVPIAVC
ncbi:MAG: VOC family protein [Pseudonocardiaceae bacterium]